MLEPAPEKICLIRTSAVGDTVHALALANGLKQGFPNASLTWVLQTIPYEMVMHQPCVDHFITFDRKAGSAGWRKLIADLRRQRFDLAVIPQVSAKVSLISLFTPAKIKLGFDWHRSRELHWPSTSHHIPGRPMGHVQDQFFEFLEYLGVRNFTKTWDFCFTPEERKWQKGYFDRIDRPAAGFVIATAHRQKEWPPACYARVMDAVKSRMGLEPVMIGGPSAREKQIAEEIAAHCKCRPVIALEKPIRRTMMQLQGCRLVVSPDTGPLHIAVAMGVPTIGLYGYSNPRRCGPYRFHDLLIDHYTDPDEQHAPVTRKTKPGRMETITPEEVIGKIQYCLTAYPEPENLPEAAK
jgi:heptosyltransferase I